MFKIPSAVLTQLYEMDFDNAIVTTSRWEYSLYCDVFVIGDICYDIVQRKSLSDPSDVQQRLLQHVMP